MKFIIGLIFGLIGICMVWAGLKVLFVAAPNTPLDTTTPGLLTQAWHESPCGTIVVIIVLIVIALIGLAKKD